MNNHNSIYKTKNKQTKKTRVYICRKNRILLCVSRIHYIGWTHFPILSFPYSFNLPTTYVKVKRKMARTNYSHMIMSAMASQITSLTIVYLTVYSGTDQRISKLRVTGLCEGNSPVTGEFPARRASNAENVSCGLMWLTGFMGQPLFALGLGCVCFVSRDFLSLKGGPSTNRNFFHKFSKYKLKGTTKKSMQV